MNDPRSDVVCFGASGHARSVADVLERVGTRIVASVDPGGVPLASEPVLLSDDAGVLWARERGLPAVVALGDNRRRLELVRTLTTAGLVLPAYVARTATVTPDADLGPGTVVFEHAHVGPRARIGSACIVNTGAVVEHDCELGEANALRTRIGARGRCDLWLGRARRVGGRGGCPWRASATG